MSQKDLGITSLLHITCVFPRSHLFWNACADLNRFHSIHGIMWFVAVWTLGTTHKHEGCLPSVFPVCSGQRMLCIQVKWTVDLGVAGNWQRDTISFWFVEMQFCFQFISPDMYVIYICLQRAIISFSKCKTIRTIHIQKQYWFCANSKMLVT